MRFKEARYHLKTYFNKAAGIPIPGRPSAPTQTPTTPAEQAVAQASADDEQVQHAAKQSKLNVDKAKARESMYNVQQAQIDLDQDGIPDHMDPSVQQPMPQPRGRAY
jgi:hypothetical protein